MEAARQVARLGWLTGDGDLISLASGQISEEQWRKWQSPRADWRTTPPGGTASTRRPFASRYLLREARATPGLRGDSLLLLVVQLLRTGRRGDVDAHLAEYITDIERIGPRPTTAVHRELIEALLARHDDRIDAVESRADALLEATMTTGYASDHSGRVGAVGRDGATPWRRRACRVAVRRGARGSAGGSATSPASSRILKSSTRPSNVSAANSRRRSTRATRSSIMDAVEFARRARGERGRPSYGWASLTATETKVAELVVQGLSNEEVARRLLMSPATAKTHLTHIYAKIGAANRTELAARWHDR